MKLMGLTLRTTIVVVMFAGSALAQTTEPSDVFEPDKTRYVYFHRADRIERAGFTFWREIEDGKEGEAPTRRIYLQRPGESQRRLVYTHWRDASYYIGHRGRHLLVNDYEATKSIKVVVVDVASGRSYLVDRQAREHYEAEAKYDRRKLVLPRSVDFSPDDRLALLQMKLDWVFAATREEAGEIEPGYPAWSYVVDAAIGKVLHVYRAPSVPKRWWVLP